MKRISKVYDTGIIFGLGSTLWIRSTRPQLAFVKEGCSINPERELNTFALLCRMSVLEYERIGRCIIRTCMKLQLI